jgi:peroxiredoxin Q/BCP
MPREGDLAPDFTLQDMHGHAITLSKLRGTKVVLYFYPKDDTSGCTLEAQEFTRLADAFARKKTVVLGVSKDSVESHCAFAQKHGLRVTLLSDPDGDAVTKYGCWVEKRMYGKTFMGIQRATFVIDEKGVIRHVFGNVNPQGHAHQVLETL